jgi:hypothetical protein
MKMVLLRCNKRLLRTVESISKTMATTIII